MVSVDTCSSGINELLIRVRVTVRGSGDGRNDDSGSMNLSTSSAVSRNGRSISILLYLLSYCSNNS